MGAAAVELRSGTAAKQCARSTHLTDSMCQLALEEWRSIRSSVEAGSVQRPGDELAIGNRSQVVTGWAKHRGVQSRPYVFTEQGVAMLSSVLRSPHAVEVNIAIMRTFVQLRRLMDANRLLARSPPAWGCGLKHLARRHAAGHGRFIQILCNNPGLFP